MQGRHARILVGVALAGLTLILVVPGYIGAPTDPPGARPPASAEPAASVRGGAPPPAANGPGRFDQGFLNVTGADATTTSLLWTDRADTTGHASLLEISSNGSTGPWRAAGNRTNSSPEAFVATGLTPGATYWYRILEREGAEGLVRSPVVESTQPELPVVTYHAAGSAPAFLSWTNPARYGGLVAFHDYTVDDSVDAGSWANVTTITNPSNTSYPLAVPAPGNTTFRVIVDDTCCGGDPVALVSNAVNNSSDNDGLYLHAAVHPKYADVGQTVTFSCLGESGVAPYTYLWTFGDGSGIGAANVTHVYGYAGNFSAVCTVTDALGDMATSRTFVIAVTPRPSVAIAVDHTSADPNYVLQFNATLSGGRTPLWRLNWTFGDGTTAAGLYVVNHSYAAIGLYKVNVSLVDGNGAGANASITVSISKLTINASESTYATPVGRSVAFAGNAVGGGGAPYSYLWNFGDNVTASGADANHSYADAGNYTVTLSVTDALHVTVVDDLPVLEVGAPLAAVIGFTPAAPTVGETVTLTAQITGGSGNYTCLWGFGDTRTATGCSTSHAWASAGAYTVSLVVTDPAGGKLSTKTVLDVSTTTGVSPPNQTAPASWISSHLLLIVIVLLAIVAVALVAWGLTRGGGSDPGVDEVEPAPPAEAGSPACANCGEPVGPDDTVCPHCHEALGP